MTEICEETEMWVDMTQWIKNVVRHNPELSEPEQELLSTAYKNVINSQRSALRKLVRIEESLERNNSKRLPIIREYKSKIEASMNQYCNEILELLETKIIPASEHNP
jgi:Na+/phosphate symporter